MKRAALLVFSVAILLLGWFAWRMSDSQRRMRPEVIPDSSEAAATGVVVTAVSTPAPAPGGNGQAASLIGETILRGYGNANLPPENDLTLMARLMDSFLLLVKSAADGPLSANEDWAAAFRGMNPAHERFLPDVHPALNAQGRLVDRWGQPLFFHALGGRRFEIRSAGPDRKLWSADDIHRNADGSFRHGAELNPPSLADGDSGSLRGQKK